MQTNTTGQVSFSVMKSNQRRFVHELAGYFTCDTYSLDPEPQRNVVAIATKWVNQKILWKSVYPWCFKYYFIGSLQFRQWCCLKLLRWKKWCQLQWRTFLVSSPPQKWSLWLKQSEHLCKNFLTYMWLDLAKSASSSYVKQLQKKSSWFIWLTLMWDLLKTSKTDCSIRVFQLYDFRSCLLSQSHM